MKYVLPALSDHNGLYQTGNAPKDVYKRQGENANVSTSVLNKIKEHIYVVNFNDQKDTKLFNMEMPTV